jgi:hypothetical protein
MATMHDSRWTRQGVSLLWSAACLSEIAKPEDVVSLRQFFALSNTWPELLPCTNGDAIVVAGVEGCLDALTPDDAERWIEEDLKPCIFDFQSEYQGQAGLIFWLPSGRQRVKALPATEEYIWHCAAPFRERTLPLGRLLWAGAEADAKRIINPNETNQDMDGLAWVGLFHPRIS